MTSLSILIPTYNEERSIAHVVTTTVEKLLKTPEVADFEVIILDDGSTDSSPVIINNLTKQFPKFIRSYRHQENKGIAYTYEQLYKLAEKKYVFMVPGDGQYPIEILFSCFPIRKEDDIILFYRKKKNYSFSRNVISRLYRLLPKIFFGVDLYDPGCTKCIKQTIFSEIHVSSKSVFVEAERMIRANLLKYNFRKIEIDSLPRIGGLAHGAHILSVLSSFKDLLKFWFYIRILRRSL